MNSDKQFSSKMQLGSPFATDVSESQIQAEPMFFNCDCDFAYEHGGPITKSFIDALPPEYRKGVFDSRTHMLMPGWYPAIPGYHHDDVPRPPIEVGKHFITAGQPDYDNPRYNSRHCMGLVNAHIAPTEFAIGECTMPKIEDGELIYRRWHNEVLSLLERGEMELVKAADRTLMFFDCQTFHQGSKAVSNGWRWFGRVSIDTDRVKTVTNQIRHQSQVYLEFPMEGW